MTGRYMMRYRKIFLLIRVRGNQRECQVKSLLAAKDYAWRGGAGEEGKGRRYDVYHYTFPSYLMEAVMNQAASQAS